MGRQAVRTAPRRHERKALQTKFFVPRTTDSTHGKRGAPNLLLGQPRPTQANQVWVSDITYLPLANGNWVHCRAFQDVCTKQVVGWQVRADVPEALVTTALQRALLAQRPAPGLIVHSDRGGQYVGTVYKTLLREAKAQLSPQSARRVLRQRAGREPLVAPQNRTARTPRLARFYGPD